MKGGKQVLYRRRVLNLRLIIAALLFCTIMVVAAHAGNTADSDLPPGSAGLIQPEELVKALQSSATKPLILYVGPRFVYAQNHIPGAEFIGAASNPEYLDRLRKRVASLPRNASVVLYCGCCAWEHCPNIRPGYNELRKMGFTNVKALYLANSFGADWVEKGYPVEKGEAANQ